MKQHDKAIYSFWPEFGVVAATQRPGISHEIASQSLVLCDRGTFGNVETVIKSGAPLKQSDPSYAGQNRKKPNAFFFFLNTVEHPGWSEWHDLAHCNFRASRVICALSLLSS